MSSARVVGILLVLVIAHGPAFAQPSATPSRAASPTFPKRPARSSVAHYVGDTPPRIDGRLDDEVWQTGAGHRRHGPERSEQHAAADRAHASSRWPTTTARSTSAVINYMTDPSKITTALGRRDTFPRSDSIKITFDPRHDHLTAYTFDSNPSGVQGDMTWFDDTRSSTDYDAVWDVRTQIHQGRLDARNSAFRFRSCASASRPASPWCGASTSAATSSTTPRRSAGSPRRVARRASCRGSAT